MTTDMNALYTRATQWINTVDAKSANDKYMNRYIHE